MEENIEDDELNCCMYWSVKYFDNDEVYSRIYHGKEDDYSIASAERNMAIEKISTVFQADSRASADRIAKDLFGIIG